jgi:hypothetical protein
MRDLALPRNRHRRKIMDRRAEIIAEKLTKAKDAGTYEVQYRVTVVETEEEDEVTKKRIKLRKMVVATPVFIFSVFYRKKQFRVSRWTQKVPKGQTPTIFYRWADAAAAATYAWTLHGDMGFAEFLTWLKTALGERAYRAYAELIA